jgi:hypothetical protein
VNPATSAFIRDVASEFLLGRGYNNLDREDFNAGVTVMFQGSDHEAHTLLRSYGDVDPQGLGDQDGGRWHQELFPGSCR